MSCGSGKITKKKIAIFSSIGIGITALTYIAFTTTNNPVIAASMPAVLGFAACPVMCIAMGGGMWFMNRLSKKKNNKNENQNVSLEEKTLPSSCCATHKASDSKAEQQKPTSLEISPQISRIDDKDIIANAPSPPAFQSAQEQSTQKETNIYKN
jgi:hypothetical protein